ncbi:MAG: DUF45 domain-containing protein [Oscillospiraceae bacterium]|nr:DUF45 domain-containing protein [Oscillospiraceae bacterium]
MRKGIHNLDAYLSLILDKYYQDGRYVIPTISWSDEYMLSRFGEYQYCENHIYISRLLDTNTVSKEAVMSVIYHEICHQDSVEHTKRFENRMALFPKYAELQHDLNDYFDSIDEVPPLQKQRTVCDDYKRIYFILLPNEYDEQYLQQFIYYNQSIFADVSVRGLPDYDNAFIIWTAKSDNDTFVVGWSDNGTLYSKKQSFAHERFGGLNLSYRIKTKSELTHIILPVNCTCIIPNDLFPKSFLKNGFCLADDITEFHVADVLTYIKGYSSDFYCVGLLDEAISSLAPMTETNASKLTALSRKQDSVYRSLWISNLAVKQKHCYETLFNRADALRFAGVLEYSFEDFKLAMEIKPEVNEPKIECIKLCIMLNRIDALRELVNHLDEGVLEKYFKQTEVRTILALMKQ